MKPPEQFQTERLIIRKPRMDDAPALFDSYLQDPAVTRYLLFKFHSNVEETKTFLQRCAVVWEKGTDFPYVICLKETGQPIGMLEIHGSGFKVELGYVIARAYWGQGLVTEVVRSVVDWAMAEPSIYRVSATCDVENIASQRVMEKAGMTREGILHRYSRRPAFGDTPRDCYIYAIVK